jgi:hypothetical protein
MEDVGKGMDDFSALGRFGQMKTRLKLKANLL